MRDEIFRSGMPLLIAGVCFVTLAYLERVRRERFLAWWAAAWALLVLRYIWNMLWGSPWPNLWTGEVSAVLRLGFALSVLAGALELRGRRLPWPWIAVAALAFPLLTSLLQSGLRVVDANRVNLTAMAVLIAIAAWQLAGTRELPRLERLVAAVALASYGALSAVLPTMGDQSNVLRFGLMASWGLQLLVGVSMIAMYFRASYESELEGQRRLGANLTEVLSGYVSICMHCKAIRDEQAQWQKLESYVATRSETIFSHGVCESCAASHYGLDDSMT